MTDSHCTEHLLSRVGKGKRGELVRGFFLGGGGRERGREGSSKANVFFFKKSMKLHP